MKSLLFGVIWKPKSQKGFGFIQKGYLVIFLKTVLLKFSAFFVSPSLLCVVIVGLSFSFHNLILIYCSGSMNGRKMVLNGSLITSILRMIVLLCLLPFMILGKTLKVALFDPCNALFESWMQ